MSTMKKRPLVKRLIALCFTVFLLLVLEIACRAFLHITGASMGWSIIKESAVPGLMWENNSRHPEINSLGMRGKERNYMKEPGTIRILCLGDSVVYGFGVAPEEAFPHLLEEMLVKKGGPGTVEVLNAAVSGYSTNQELAYLREKGNGLQPDIVIVGFVLNDVTGRFHRPSAVHCPAELFLRKHCALYYCLRGAYLKVRKEISKREEPLEVQAKLMSEGSPAMEKAWTQVLYEIEQIEEECRKSQTRFLLVVFPFCFQLSEAPEEAVPQRRLLEFCASREIPVIDLLPELSARDGTLFIDSTHLSSEGNAVAARLVYDALLERGMLGSWR